MTDKTGAKRQTKTLSISAIRALRSVLWAHDGRTIACEGRTGNALARRGLATKVYGRLYTITKAGREALAESGTLQDNEMIRLNNAGRVLDIDEAYEMASAQDKYVVGAQ